MPNQSVDLEQLMLWSCFSLWFTNSVRIIYVVEVGNSISKIFDLFLNKISVF
eukprot:m.11726 g.11726  ORF g.11726 m.11726 type:complete len:52 (+) comp8948_c0_seq1:1058-1213(+)